MPKLQKLLLNTVAIFLLASAAALALQNMDVTQTNIQFLGGTLIDFPLGVVLALMGFLVGGALLMKAWERTLELGTQYKKANRDLERKNVSSEEAESKVKVLESKIETLEKALSAAIKSQQSK
jgi:uncharacterized integral membrane protein